MHACSCTMIYIRKPVYTVPHEFDSGCLCIIPVCCLLYRKLQNKLSLLASSGQSHELGGTPGKCMFLCAFCVKV